MNHNYLQLADDVPVCSLIDRLKALHRAVPPEAPSPEIPVVHTDARYKHAAEPLQSACGQDDVHCSIRSQQSSES